MPPTSINFKEQMSEVRRTQILLGAAKVFAKKGFHKATTKEIAKTAGISEGTIYNYFENKRELLVAMIELLALQPLKNIVNTDLSPTELLTAIIQDRYRLVKEQGYLLAPVIAEIFADTELRAYVYQKIIIPASSYLEHYIQANIASGQFRQVDPVLITRAFMGATMLNFTIKITQLDPRYDNITVDTMIEQLVPLFLNGIGGRD